MTDCCTADAVQKVSGIKRDKETISDHGQALICLSNSYNTQDS